MKKILLILLLFLLPLYLVPPTAAVYGDESPQSITSFAETLPDDVLYYPDSFSAGLIELADYGEISDESYSADYILTHVKDGSAFNETSATDIEIWFEVDTTDGFEGFSYAHFLDVDSGTDVDLAAYDFNQDFFVKIDEPVPSSYAWMNGTIYDPDYWNTTHIAFTMYELSGNADLYWDYGEITIHRMTLADSDHYAEGFNDVSDWTKQEGPAEMTSDGDQGQFDLPDDNAYDRFYSDVPSIAQGVSSYWEIRASTNDSTALSCYLLVYGYSTDGYGSGSSIPYVILDYIDDDGTTLKGFYDGTYALECIVVIAKALIGGHAIEVSIDYLRVGPADEMGLQHDGSTTEGITPTANMVVTTDGDELTLTPSADAEYILFDVDTTTTATTIESYYYPFFETYISSVTDGDADGKVWLIQLIGTDANEYTTPSPFYADETGYHRFNVKASTIGDLVQIKIYIEDSLDRATFDFIKLYSIANWTVYQSGASIDDFLYVDSGVLYSELDSGPEYIRLGYYPSLSVDTNKYTILNVSSSGYAKTALKVLVDAVQYYPISFTSETEAELIFGTLTSIIFWYFYDSASWSAIKFIDARDWQEIGEVDFVIPVGWDPTFIFGYDAFFIFLGLILIPVSTMYLVRGGREEASADKVFYFLIMFMIGFGLLVGGIMP